jgi:hypothetical protein
MSESTTSPQHPLPKPLTDQDRERLEELRNKKVLDATLGEYFDYAELRGRDMYQKFTSKG